jgi:CheY-like chemotaxis protein
LNPRSFGQPTILLIDENASVLASTRSTLEAAGFRVLTQSRAAGAVSLILQSKPDLVLLDLNAVTAGGEVVAKLFGREQPSSETLVLLHSPLPVETSRPRALAAGAHGSVQRTDDAFELLKQINAWLKIAVRTSHTRLKVASRTDLPRVEQNEAPPPLAAQEPVGQSARSAAAAQEPVGQSARSAAAAQEPVDRPSFPEFAVPSASPSPRVSGTRALDWPLVLFIDDDMGTLSGFRREVQTEPYAVEFALSGTRALERIASEAPPDLVVSDLLMPEPAGPEIFRQALAIDPSFRDRFIFVTGASRIGEMGGFLVGLRGAVLYKPVSGQDLRSAIRRALAVRERARTRSL